jgi:hypothetical protein
MNPVIGLDIAKGKSEGQAFLDKGKPCGKSFGITHTREGLDNFLHLLKEIEAKKNIRLSYLYPALEKKSRPRFFLKLVR